MTLHSMPIADGVTLHTLHTERFKTGYLALNFLLPLRRETASFAALLPHLLKRGTRSYPDMTALNRRLEMLYDTTIAESVSRVGETQCVSFRVTFLENRYVTDGTDLFAGAIDVLREILFDPITEDGVFRADYTATEQNAQIDAIASRINNKATYSIIRCREIMCADEHYSVSSIGCEDGVHAITPETLYSFYRDFLRTSRIEIFYVGQLDDACVNNAVTHLFSDCPRAYAPLPGTRVLRRAEHAAAEHCETASVGQAKLVLGFRTGHILADGDYEIFSTFLSLYGASPTNKLFQNVREKRSLCYSIRAGADPHKGVMTVSCGISPADREAAQREILAQLDEVRKCRISEDELNAAKEALLGSYREMVDSPYDTEVYYLGRIMTGIRSDPAASMARVRAVTAEEIAAFTRDITLDTVYFLEPSGKQIGVEEEEEA